MGDTPAAGQKRPRPGGAEGDDDDDDSRVKKRLQKFAKIGRDQRCGVCRECLNPKSKKACLTVRAQQEREARQQETAERVARELHRLRQGEAALERVLSEALDAEGRFSEARHAPLVARHMKNLPILEPQGLITQGVLLAVLQDSARACGADGGALPFLGAFAASDGVHTLVRWLRHARDSDNTGLTEKILRLIGLVPMTLALLVSSKAGKVVKQLRKVSPHPAVKATCKALMASWTDVVKTEVKAEKAGGGGGAATAKNRSSSPPETPQLGRGDGKDSQLEKNTFFGFPGSQGSSGGGSRAAPRPSPSGSEKPATTLHTTPTQNVKCPVPLKDEAAGASPRKEERETGAGAKGASLPPAAPAPAPAPEPASAREDPPPPEPPKKAKKAVRWVDETASPRARVGGGSSSTPREALPSEEGRVGAELLSILKGGQLSSAAGGRMARRSGPAPGAGMKAGYRMEGLEAVRVFDQFEECSAVERGDTTSQASEGAPRGPGAGGRSMADGPRRAGASAKGRSRRWLRSRRALGSSWKNSTRGSTRWRVTGRSGWPPLPSLSQRPCSRWMPGAGTSSPGASSTARVRMSTRCSPRTPPSAFSVARRLHTRPTCSASPSRRARPLSGASRERPRPSTRATWRGGSAASNSSRRR